MKYLISILMILFIFFHTAQPSDDDIKRKQIELNKLRNDIETWESKIKQKEKSEKSTLELLDTYDNQLNLLRKLINRLHSDKTALENEIVNTKQNISELEKQLNFIKKQYANFVTIAYKHGRTYDLELLISSKSLNQLYIRSVYLKNFSEQRQKDINKIEDKNIDLENQKAIFEKQLTEQKKIIFEKAKEEEKLISKTHLRKKALEEIRRDKKNYSLEINRKRNAVKDLEQLIAKLIDLERTKAKSSIEANEINTSYSPGIGMSFEKRRGKLPWPVTRGKVIGKFGNQKHPVLKTITQNTGIDIAVLPGTDVFAIADGEVSTIWWLPSFGNLVIVNHQNGYRTVYANLSNIEVNEGDKISEGSLIGKSSETINGSLVHFELWKDREKQDPENWLHPREFTKR